MSIDRWKSKLSAAAPVRERSGNAITKTDIHDTANEKGVVWDSEKPGSDEFLRMSKRVTGKTHLDEMNQQELGLVYADLEKRAGYRTDEIVDALRTVLSEPTRTEHIKAWSRHAALNIGQAKAQGKQALRGVDYKGRPASRAEEAKDAVHSTIFAALPPTHHTRKEMVEMLPFSHKEWYRHGAGGPSPLAKKAGHVEDRTRERAPGAAPDVARLRRVLGGLKLRKGRTYHYALPRGRGSVIVGPTKRSHVVKTVYGPRMKAPGSWISEASVRAALRKQSTPIAKEAASDGHWRKLAPTQTGHDRGGTEISGKTWVTQNRLKASFKAMEHQEDFSNAALKELKRGGGIIAAHGTGTGKTPSAIYAFEKLKGKGQARRALVLTPAGLRDNFLNKGVKKFTNSQGVILKKPTAVADNVEYVVVSYAAFRNDPMGFVNMVKPDTIIADEIHRASNPDGKTYKAIAQARQHVPKFIGLTASVVQNKPDEIVPLLNLASGGNSQIPTKKKFRRAHVAKRKSEQRGIFGGTTYEKKLVRTAMLKANLGASVHYVEDLDASKKPSKEVETVDVLMSKQQRKLYDMAMSGIDPVIRKKIAEGLPVSKKKAMNVFMQLMRARQVSNSLHLAVPNMTVEQAAQQTPKIKRILEDAMGHIKKTPDAQVIMYTNLVHGGVDVLEAGLKAQGIAYGVFAGKGVKGITEDTRQAAVDDYIAGKNKVIIITGAGAEGLSLGNTTMVQLVDGHYNPERMSQATARGVRAGGLSHRAPEDRKVQVKRYVSALPKTFWQSLTFKDAERSVGQWVYQTAGKKEGLNRQLRDVLKSRSDQEKRRRDGLAFRIRGRKG